MGEKGVPNQQQLLNRRVSWHAGINPLLHIYNERKITTIDQTSLKDISKAYAFQTQVNKRANEQHRIVNLLASSIHPFLWNETN